jgi:hypothetical protein
MKDHFNLYPGIILIIYRSQGKEKNLFPEFQGDGLHSGMITDPLIGYVYPYLPLGHQEIVPVSAEIRDKLDGHHNVGSYQFEPYRSPGNSYFGIRGIPYDLLVPFHHPGHNIHNHGLFLKARQEFLQRGLLSIKGSGGQDKNTSQKGQEFTALKTA